MGVLYFKGVETVIEMCYDRRRSWLQTHASRNSGSLGDHHLRPAGREGQRPGRQLYMHPDRQDSSLGRYSSTFSPSSSPRLLVFGVVIPLPFHLFLLVERVLCCRVTALMEHIVLTIYLALVRCRPLTDRHPAPLCCPSTPLGRDDDEGRQMLQRG